MTRFASMVLVYHTGPSVATQDSLERRAEDPRNSDASRTGSFRGCSFKIANGCILRAPGTAPKKAGAARLPTSCIDTTWVVTDERSHVSPSVQRARRKTPRRDHRTAPFHHERSFSAQRRLLAPAAPSAGSRPSPAVSLKPTASAQRSSRCCAPS